jgi:hypothetical protein
MTTQHLSLTHRARWSAWIAQRDPLALLASSAAGLFLLAAIVRRLFLVGAPALAIAPTPALPIILIATAPPAPAAPVAPVQQIAYQQPARYVAAFAAPGGAILGPIPAPRLEQLLARYGSDWIMTAWQGHNVWVRAGDLGLDLANLAPALAPVEAQQAAPELAAPTPTEEQAYQTDSQPGGAAPATLSPEDLSAINDPAQNGNNLAPPGCPFPIINGVCGNGVLARNVPDVAPRPSTGARAR